jgi:GH15 family glucan-1,4-alpha-glucosidase
VRRRYLGDSLVLESQVDTDSGSVTVVDCLAVSPDVERDAAEAGHVLVRLLRATAGEVRVEVDVDARPGYGTGRADWEVAEDGWAAAGTPVRIAAQPSLDRTEGRLVASWTLRRGETAALLLSYGDDRPHPDRADELVERSRAAWQAWSDRCEYQGIAEEHVRRGALVLRGLAFDDTGALLAAPTTSLPEEIGGVRNWDYRFTWHRDASLVVLALFRLGHAEAGARYLDFVLREVEECADRLLPMATIAQGRGSTVEVEERVLDHLEGYRGSRPVRVGNEAFEQDQLDSYGHVLDAAHAYHAMTGDLDEARWRGLRRLVEIVAARWQEPDHGLWEMRGAPRHYVNSKVMAWVCLDRGIRLAEELDPGAPVEEWRAQRDAVHREVCDRGFDAARGAFTMTYDAPELDASLLRIPLVGFLPGDDDRVRSTVARIAEELGCGGALIRRYDTEQVDDGVAGSEGAFLLSSFEMVAALVLCGRADEARRRFDELCAAAGSLGLFSEEMAADGTALGNYPQAFTHLALIEAALNLDAAGDEEALHAWATRQRP